MFMVYIDNFRKQCIIYANCRISPILMRKLIAIVTQYFFWIFVGPFIKFFLRIEVITKIDLRNLKKPFIIVANHVTAMDPIIIGSLLPLGARVIPIRFAVWHKYYHFPCPYALIAQPMGAFPVQKKVGLAKTLKPGIEALERGEVVGIFPEGRRVHFGRPRKGRRGAAYMAIRTGAPVLPVCVRGTMGLTFKNVFFRQRKVKVYIGEPFKLPPHLTDHENIPQLNEASDYIVTKIRELPQKFDKLTEVVINGEGYV